MQNGHVSKFELDWEDYFEIVWMDNVGCFANDEGFDGQCGARNQGWLKAIDFAQVLVDNEGEVDLQWEGIKKDGLFEHLIQRLESKDM